MADQQLNHQNHITILPFPSRSHTSLPTLLPLTLQYLLPQHLLHHPQIIRLPIHNVFQILDVLPKFFDLGIIKRLSLRGRFFDVEARADVDEDVLVVCELAGDVEGGGEGDEDGFVWFPVESVVVGHWELACITFGAFSHAGFDVCYALAELLLCIA